jgi:hypothetical protein
MRRLAPIPLLVLLVSVLAPEPARGSPIDAVTAREQLKQGYALKKEGHCADAVAHLVESERLDPQAKTLLNLAECEDSLGRLVDADAHLLEARDRARTEGHPELETIANQRLAIIDKRVPRLTVVLAADASPATQVFRDSTLLRDVSLGVALPVDAGPHTVVATAAGIGTRRFEVTLKESESQALTVSPVVGGAPSSVAPTSTPNGDAGSSVSHLPAIVAFGVGGVGAIVGTIFAIRAYSRWSDAKSECFSTTTCGSGTLSASSTSDARTSATVADVGFIAGGVGLAAGVVLLLLESRASGSPASTSATGARSLWLDPQVGTTGGSLFVGGRF